MTEQTKRYVELSDLVNVHLTCKHCGGTYEIRWTEEGEDFGRRDCPTCNLFA